MNRLLIAALCAAPMVVSAESAFHPIGQNLVYGVNNTGQSAITSVSNPATAASALQSEEDSRFRMGLMSVGVGYEVGDAENFADDLDRLIDKTKLGTLTATEVNDIIAGSPGNLLDEFNTILPKASEDGYATFTMAGQVLTPLIVASERLGGAVSLDLNVAGNVKLGVLDDTVVLVNPNSSVSFDGDEELSAGNTSLFVQGGSVAELALGYGRSVMKSDSGSLYAGAKLKLLNVELGRTTALLDDSTDVDTAMEEFDENSVEDSTTTVDLGLLWMSDNYQVGVSLLNTTSPSFEYPQISFNCASLVSAAAQARCSAAIADNEYEMSAQARIEGGWHSESRNWLVTFAYDANETETPAGDEVQWGVVGLAYAPESWWVPGLRVGHRANMAGSELGFWTAGLTLFKVMSLDLAYATESTVVDGDEVPRAASANLTFDLRF